MNHRLISPNRKSPLPNSRKLMQINFKMARALSWSTILTLWTSNQGRGISQQIYTKTTRKSVHLTAQ